MGSAANAYIALLALNHREYFAQFVQTISLHNKLQKLEDASCVVHLCRDQCIAHSAHEAHPPTGGIVVSSQRAPSEGNLSGIKD